MLSLCLQSSQGPQGLTTCFPSLIRCASHPVRNSTHLVCFLTKQTSSSLLSPQPNSFHFPTRLQHYSSKESHLSAGTRGFTSSFCCHKPAPYKILLVHSVPLCNSHLNVLLPWAVSICTKKLLSVSSA